MSTVVESISEFQKVQQRITPTPAPPSAIAAPAHGPDDNGVRVRTLDELRRPLKNDGQELLKNRFLCKRGGLLLVGPTGIGKSSLAMQLMICWALGKGVFGIEPVRPITSLLIQAENDEGDLAEMRDGVFSGLNISDQEREEACHRIFPVQENARAGEAFFNETVRPMLQETNPDLLWIDPALAYLGGENNSQEAVGAFLRNHLAPLLIEFNCAAVVIHHTNKQSNSQDKKMQADSAYLGGGSAEWSNWSRAMLTLQRTKTASVFELKAPKRGNRLGWKAADGLTTAYNRFIAHNKEPGTICWVDVVPEIAAAVEKGNGKSPEDVLKHVPVNRPVAKNTLIKACAENGIGLNTARNLINELVDAGRLFVWSRPRKGSKPENFLARIPQPVDSNGQKMFTEIFTAQTGHEDLHENEIERSSHSHGPLGPVKIDREDHEHQDHVALLPVGGTKACEDQPGEDGPPKPPACILNREPAPPPASVPLAIAQAAPQSSSGCPPLRREPIEAVLVRLGEILTKDELHVPFRNMKEVAKECQKHRGQVKKVACGYLFNAREMENQAMKFFEKHHHILTDKVRIEYRTEPKEREHRNDKGYELQLAFHKFDPANNTCAKV